MGNAYHYQNTFRDDLADEFKGLLSLGIVHSPDKFQNLWAWWDAADTKTIIANANAVSQWNDKSGNNHHFVQADVSLQPSSGINSMNGKNVISWDGAQKRQMNLSQLYTIAEMSFFVVHDTPLNSQQSFLCQSNSQNQRIQVAAVASQGYGRRIGGGNEINLSNPVTTKEIFAFTASDSNENLTYSIGGDFTTVDYTQGLKRFNIVGSNSFNSICTGSIAEMIVFDRILALSEMLKIRSYLEQKWGFLPA